MAGGRGRGVRLLAARGRALFCVLCPPLPVVYAPRMITFLHGKVVERQPARAVLDVGPGDDLRVTYLEVDDGDPPH